MEVVSIWNREPMEKEMPRVMIWKLLCIFFTPKHLIHGEKTGGKSFRYRILLDFFVRLVLSKDFLRSFLYSSSLDRFTWLYFGNLEGFVQTDQVKGLRVGLSFPMPNQL